MAFCTDSSRIGALLAKAFECSAQSPMAKMSGAGSAVGVDRDAVTAFRAGGDQWGNRRDNTNTDNHHIAWQHLATREADA